MSSVEAGMAKQADTGQQRRKHGLQTLPLVTVARAELDGQWAHLIAILPEAQAKKFQNDDGTFPYLPGWDGPIQSQG